jgi:FtsH-binding integral membrane protein
MTAAGFMLLLTFLIAGGLAVAALVATQTYHMKFELWWVVPYIGCGFIGCVLGVSRNVPLQLIGYALIILPTGWIMGPLAKLYQFDSVIMAVWITVAVTVFLGIVGAMWHSSVAHWGGYLLTALLVLIIVELASIVMIIITGQKSHLRQLLAVTDWVAIAIFCGFVFYDMNQAVRMPSNASNAIYSAIAMYLNIINLWARILARTGKLAIENAPDAAAAVAGAAFEG